ncbi:MAG: ATP-binding cassette domain-containing protein [Acidobacteriota bacterium]
MNRPTADAPPLLDRTARVGEVLVLLGPTGAGKARLLSRIAASDASAENVVQDNLGPRPRVGRVGPEGLALPGSIYDNVALALRALPKAPLDLVDRVETALRQAALWDEVSNRLDEPAAQLSFGQRQRLSLARALALEPRVLLLEDATNGCDLVTSQRVESSLRELSERCIVVFATADPLRARRLGDRVAFVHGDEILECSATEDFFTRPENSRTAEFLGGPRGVR